MKNLLIVLLIVLGLSSCTEDKSKTYTLKYVVFYPNYNDTVEVSNTRGYHWYSQQGSNYIYNCKTNLGVPIYGGSAPYKILSYTVKENK